MLLKRAEEEVQQSEIEMKQMLNVISMKIRELEENKRCLLELESAAKYHKVVLIEMEIERLQNLFDSSVSIFRREKGLFHITNDNIGNVKLDFSIFLASHVEKDLDFDLTLCSDVSSSESDAISDDEE